MRIGSRVMLAFAFGAMVAVAARAVTQKLHHKRSVQALPSTHGIGHKRASSMRNVIDSIAVPRTVH